MNRYILTLIFAVFSFFSSSAQYTYQPVPTNGSVWVYRTDTPDQGYEIIDDWQLMMNGEDTVLNGIHYTKIMYRVSGKSYYFTPGPYPFNRIASTPDRFYGGFRQDGKKAYMVYGSATKERLIYDFDLQLNQVYTDSFIGQSKVIAVDTVFVANKLRKRFTMQNLVPAGHLPNHIVEGYCGDYGLDISIGSGQYSYTGLICFHYDDEYYCNPDCMYILPYGTPESVAGVATDNSNIYPNPFTDELKIKVTQPGIYTLFNTVGVRILQENLSAGIHSINTGSLSPGFYFITLRDEEGKIIQTQKLQKQ
ncbi:MAG: T9SS type A sorting domain-containing protein [Bacteroidetes bacterium]|nr:T9SS type A sorting domain-containing protein [Bacteroidota bacterium]